MYDAAEIDGLSYIKSNTNYNPGDLVNVKIIMLLEYDLMGDV